MPYNLESLWNTGSMLSYATSLGVKLRESASIEENASFLVRWASEVYAEWATWLLHSLPGCIVGKKEGTLRIVDKIVEMVKEKKVAREEDGWKDLTDMLRATYKCSTAQQVLRCLDLLFSSHNIVKVLRLKPRFGAKGKGLNDVMVNFDYKGQMICEL